MIQLDVLRYSEFPIGFTSVAKWNWFQILSNRVFKFQPKKEWSFQSKWIAEEKVCQLLKNKYLSFIINDVNCQWWEQNFIHSKKLLSFVCHYCFACQRKRTFHFFRSFQLTLHCWINDNSLLISRFNYIIEHNILAKTCYKRSYQ